MTALAPLLAVHIAAGGVGIVSGATALAAPKGGRLHRNAGNLFFGSMLAMAGLGAVVAALRPDRTTTVVGVFTFYLVATAWATIRRPEGTTGRFETGALAVVLAAAAADLLFGLQGANAPRGLIDGVPFQVGAVFGAVAAFAAAMDVRVIRRGGLSGAPRISRHVWRMCLALAIAGISFFIGQQKVMPAAWRGAPIFYFLPLAPLLLMIFWLIRVRFTDRFKANAAVQVTA